MACFTDTPPANWTYNILRTLASFVEGYSPITLGCYAQMNSSEQAYQFYQVLKELDGAETYLSQNCFVQLTEPQQWDQINQAIENFLTPPL